jgi:hypothetical protein
VSEWEQIASRLSAERAAKTAAVVELAQSVAAYWHSLDAEGLPEGIVDDLTCDYQDRLLDRVFGAVERD